VPTKSLGVVSEPAHYFYISPHQRSYKQKKITLIVSDIQYEYFL